MPLQEFFPDAYYNCCGTEVCPQLSQSCAQRACSQMEKFPKYAFNDSSAHKLSNEREKKKNQISQSGKWIVLTAQTPWKQKGILWKINSIPTHEAGKAVHMEETCMKATDFLWNRIEKL